MSIRIRVYPQPHSIGARRNRARRQQQQLIRQSFSWQQQLLRQQMQQRMFGMGGLGFGSSFGGATGGYFPGASSWGFRANPYAFSTGMYASPIQTAWTGAYAVPGYGYGGYQQSSYSTGHSPFGVAQQGYAHGYDNC